MKLKYTWKTIGGNPPRLEETFKFPRFSLKVMKIGETEIDGEFSTAELECSIILPAGSPFELLEQILHGELNPIEFLTK